jgi:hypothetical protein
LYSKGLYHGLREVPGGGGFPPRRR